MRAARLLALDWGTSVAACLSARRRRRRASKKRRQPWGILHLPEGGFAAALRGVAGDWLDADARAAGHRLGHGRQRAGLARGALCRLSGRCADSWPRSCCASRPGRACALHIVPGVRLAGARPDVMRGEETQIVGVLGAAAGAGRARRAGDAGHAQQVGAACEAGRIVDFHTYMTGELFALLREHSILGRPAREAGGGQAMRTTAFDRGVSAVRARARPARRALLFSARTLVLGGQLRAGDSLEYLSGLLVGEELRCALLDDDAVRAACWSATRRCARAIAARWRCSIVRRRSLAKARLRPACGRSPRRPALCATGGAACASTWPTCR